MNRLSSLLRFALAIALLASLVGCWSVRVDFVEPHPPTKLSASLLPVETSGIFGYQDWKENLDALIGSTALQVGIAIDAESPAKLRLYLSDKTFVRGYQTLHALYATVELRQEGQLLRQAMYSEETQDTFESSHKLYQVVRTCLERLVADLKPAAPRQE